MTRLALLPLVAALFTPLLLPAQSCGNCHREQQNLHAQSPHARALSLGLEHPLKDRFAASVVRGTRFAFRLEPGRVRAADRDSDSTIDLPVEWAFGSGRQAVTFVTRVDAGFHLEHFWTWYPSLGRFGPTPGQAGLRPTDLRGAVGLLYKNTDPETGIQGCFECHATGAVDVNAATPAKRVPIPGVQCAACHTGSVAAHLANPVRGTLGNPGRMSAGQLNHFCGRCHRPPASPGQNIDWNYAWNVRHQPIYLAESACFRKAQGKLTCLTCHDPHTAAGPRAAAYNARCTGCHQGMTNKPPNCVDCHMPRVSPQEGLRFTNHWIGVYGEGAKLRPRNAR